MPARSARQANGGGSGVAQVASLPVVVVARSKRLPPPPPLRAPRRLVLMRHADSEVSRAVRDHDRPVTAVGVAAARQVREGGGVAGGVGGGRGGWGAFAAPRAVVALLTLSPPGTHRPLAPPFLSPRSLPPSPTHPPARPPHPPTHPPRQVAQQMRERGWVPQVVICSNALRTRQTLEAMQVGGVG